MNFFRVKINNTFLYTFQALECEILMPLTLAGPKTCVVLTGDHHQIGPMVYSQEARRQKFDESILVRLFNYYEQIANCGVSQITERSQVNYPSLYNILRTILKRGTLFSSAIISFNIRYCKLTQNRIHRFKVFHPLGWSS